jgi:hypothetical protein
MPEIITCPDCDRKLRVPDNLLGKKVKCPGCGVMFTATAGSPARGGRPAAPPDDDVEDPVEAPAEDRRRPARDAVVRRDDYDDRRPRRRDDEDDRRVRRRDDDYDDEPRPRRRDDDYDDDYGPSPREMKEGWRKVKTGVNLNIIGTWVWIGGAAFMGIGALIGLLLLGSTILSLFSTVGAGRQPNSSQASAVGAGVIILGITGVIYGLCTLAELILRVIGYGMCMAVPSLRGTGLRPLAITSFSLAAAEAAFAAFGFIWGLVGGIGVLGSPLMLSGGNVLGVIGGVLGLAGFIVFLFFGRSVAAQVKDRGLASNLLSLVIVFAVYYVVRWAAVCGLFFGFFGTMFNAATSRTASGAAATIGTFGVIAMVLGGLMFVAYLGMEVWYIFVLARLRDGVQRRLAKL